jgi:hypothetical protein
MHRFVHATVFIAGIFAAVVAGPLLGHSTTSVMGCGQTDCGVGGANPDNPGQAQGSHVVHTDIVSTSTQSGIEATTGRTTLNQLGELGQVAAGRIDPVEGTGRGHFVNTAISGTEGVCNGVCPK